MDLTGLQTLQCKFNNHNNLSLHKLKFAEEIDNLSTTLGCGLSLYLHPYSGELSLANISSTADTKINLAPKHNLTILL